MHRAQPCHVLGQGGELWISDGLEYSAVEEAGGGGGQNYPVRDGCAFPHSNDNDSGILESKKLRDKKLP